MKDRHELASELVASGVISLKAMKQLLVATLLTINKGNKAKTARELGVDRRTLDRYIKKICPNWSKDGYR